LTELSSIGNSYADVVNFRTQFSDNFLLAHLNVNSLRNKFPEIHEMLRAGSLNVLTLSETKIDPSFTSSQFHVEGYRLYRKDRTSRGGGLLIYVQSHIPHRRRADLECDVPGIENIVLEVIIKDEVFLIIHMYRPPNVPIMSLNNALSSMMDKCLTQCKSVFIIGDLNVDLKSQNHALSDLLDAMSLKNIIKEPTCFKSLLNPSLIDVVLTNTPKRVLSHLNVDVDISDHHNLVCVATRLHAPRNEPRWITYRSYRKMNEGAFINDLASAPLHVSNIFDDPSDQVWFYNTVLNEVIEQHAPLKKKKLKCPPLPYMNSELRKAINVKAMLKRKYLKMKSNGAWNRYKAQRNLVTNLKRKSVNNYFKDRCTNINVDNGNVFWNAVSPFCTDKKDKGSRISLNVNNTVINDQTDVCNAFNNFFVNVSSTDEQCMTVDEANEKYSNNASVQSITSNRDPNAEVFNFQEVTSSLVEKKLKSLKVKKATGHDQIPAKILKLGASTLCTTLTPIINSCLTQSQFPDDYKLAEVRPIHKKKDVMDMGNYRPVSVLTSASKILEGIMCDQIMEFMSSTLSPMLSAYRSKYSCVNVLLKCTEDWKKALEKK
jgi:hypothetical protein